MQHRIYLFMKSIKKIGVKMVVVTLLITNKTHQFVFLMIMTQIKNRKFKILENLLWWSVYFLILLLDCPPCTDGVHIVGRWCYTPCEMAKETLHSVPYLVNFNTLYFIFRCPSTGVFLSSPRNS